MRTALCLCWRSRGSTLTRSVGELICAYILAVCHLNPLPVSGAAFCYRDSNTRCFPIPSSDYGTWTRNLDLDFGSEARATKGTMQERMIQRTAMTGLTAQRFERQGDRILQRVQGFMSGVMVSRCGLAPSMETSVNHHHIFIRHNFAIILPVPVSFSKFE